MKRSKSGQKQGGWWPYEKRVEVISAYIATGSSKLVESLTGVANGTVRQWRCQDWWKELEAQMRSEGNMELDAKLRKLVDKSLDAVMDRLENGEFIFNVKTGKVDRMPAKLRDVAKVASEAIDKSVLLQKFTRNVEELPKLDDHLKKLAAEFASIIRGNTNAVYDQRKEGLQEGTELGAPREAQQGERPVSKEFSQIDGDEEGGEESPEGEGCGAQESDFEGGSEYSGESRGGDVGEKSLVLPK